MPAPISTFPPPTTVRVNPNPVLVNVGPLTDRSFDRRNLRSTNDRAFLWREQECVFVAVGGNTVAGDETKIINRFADAQNLKVAGGEIADRIEITHLAIAVEKRVHLTIGRGRESDNLARCIAGERAALVSSERAEVRHSFFRVQEGVIRSGICDISSTGHGICGGASRRATDAAERTRSYMVAFV